MDMTAGCEDLERMFMDMTAGYEYLGWMFMDMTANCMSCAPG